MAHTLSLDVGNRRIGVALSDATGLVAAPLTTLTRRSLSVDTGAVADLAREHDAPSIVVGLPLSLDGTVGPQAQAVRRFCRALRKATDASVATWDERFTTAEAERRLREAGVQPSRDRARVDALAAAIILQDYLDTQRAAGP
jgi:putative Holliday junction resolvase